MRVENESEKQSTEGSMNNEVLVENCVYRVKPLRERDSVLPLCKGHPKI